MIRESILTTRLADGGTHIAPMGVHEREGGFLVLPFQPSATLDNLLREGFLVINFTDDVRVIAGCLTGRRDWPLTRADRVPVQRLESTLSHMELAVERYYPDEQRPGLFCRPVHVANHQPFMGFNRAQWSVVEAAILISRLHMLPMERVDSEMQFLKVALEKTAGEREWEAWGWLEEKVAAFKAENLEQGEHS
ncbi:DUF447 domain-containing protein [Thiohalorhabdus methylotrophus]|uniref:DUF447 domain-containing protein n=1 Tax=Thiohalorhabdus methylotrophus TaxID=3242694 RepID=A0ABV4TVB7_9GAMM